MDAQPYCEEWVYGAQTMNRVKLNIIHGVIKLAGVTQKNPSVSSSFRKWIDLIADDWLQKLANTANLLSQNGDIYVEATDFQQKSYFRGQKKLIIDCIEQAMKDIIQNSQDCKFQKEKWLIERRRLEHFKELDKVYFSTPLVERIRFWKKSLFPTISIENFWNKVENLEPCLKLKIFETELLSEQNNQQQSFEDIEIKMKTLKTKEKNLIKKEQELNLYQEFLENECAEIQKQWNDISKVADDFEYKPNFNQTINLVN